MYKHKGRCRTWSDEELLLAVTKADTMKGVLELLGLTDSCGSRSTVKKRAIFLGIDLPNGLTNPSAVARRMAILKDHRNRLENKLDSVFCENSKHDRSTIRGIILRLNLIEYKCRDCGLIDVWNGKGLTLQIEHVNGKRRDHRLENLCWLCPNCHSQTPTYNGKNVKRWKEGRKIDRRRKGYNKENRPHLRKVVYDDVVAIAFSLKNFKKTGEIFGITGNMVRKILKKYIGFSPKKGQWEQAELSWKCKTATND